MCQPSRGHGNIFFAFFLLYANLFKNRRKKHMRKLTLNLPETETIDINGDIFEIRKSDIDILNKSAELQSRYSDLKKDDLQSIQAAVNETTSFIDEILGNGATAEIGKGKPVSIKLAIEWLTAICAEISRSGEEYIKEKYE